MTDVIVMYETLRAVIRQHVVLKIFSIDYNVFVWYIKNWHIFLL